MLEAEGEVVLGASPPARSPPGPVVGFATATRGAEATIVFDDLAAKRS